MYTSDREQIKEVVEKVGQLRDYRQWDKLADCFVEKPMVDTQSLSGEPPEQVTKTNLITSWRRELSSYYYATKRLIKRMAVSVRGKQATATSAIEDAHFIIDRGDRYVWTVSGTNEYELVKSGGVWKISSLKFKLKNQELRPLGQRV